MFKEEIAQYLTRVTETKTEVQTERMLKVNKPERTTVCRRGARPACFVFNSLTNVTVYKRCLLYHDSTVDKKHLKMQKVSIK